MTSSWFVLAQLLPQRTVALTILGDVVIDSLVAHCHLAATVDLTWTPVFAKSCLNLLPLLGIDPWLRTGCVTSFDAARSR
ncbi:MAG: hypothetical protein ABIO49_02765 [Dokdonella sp.]